MLMMRLQRVGRKNDPSYRIVVVDKRTGPKSNKHVDYVGFYSPKIGEIKIDKDKAKHWLSKGVQPSDTIYNILISQKVIEGRKKNVLPKKSPIIDEAKLKAEAEAKAKAEEEAKAKAEAEAAASAEAEKASEVATPEVADAPETTTPAEAPEVTPVETN